MSDYGDCSGCGKCCQYVLIPMGFKSADWNEWLYRHGCLQIPGRGVLIPSQCPHLKRNCIDCRWYCDIYETRPALCHFSVLTNLRFKGCTVKNLPVFDEKHHLVEPVEVDV